MKHRLICIAALCGLGMLILGCPGRDDEALIRELLQESPYTAEGSGAVVDDESDTLKSPPGPILLTDTLPWVRWCRRLDRPVTWELDIDVTGDTAYAWIDALLTGNLYVDTLPRERAVPIIRPIEDSAHREVKLYWDGERWRIHSLTPWDSYTVGGEPRIEIEEVRAEVVNLDRDYEFILTDPKRLLTRDELPTFEPSDTVEVTVRVSVPDDSAWAFLHHGRRHRRGLPGRHHRVPFYKEGTHTFTRQWIIACDSVATPGVRHAAVDLLSWATLFGDSTAPYSSRVWALPYIVKLSDEPIPPDREEE